MKFKILSIFAFIFCVSNSNAKVVINDSSDGARNMYFGVGATVGAPFTPSFNQFGQKIGNPVLFGFHSRFGNEWHLPTTTKGTRFYVAVDGYFDFLNYSSFRNLSNNLTLGNGLNLGFGVNGKLGVSLLGDEKLKVYGIIGLGTIMGFPKAGFDNNDLLGFSGVLVLNVGLGLKYKITQSIYFFSDLIFRPSVYNYGASGATGDERPVPVSSTFAFNFGVDFLI